MKLQRSPGFDSPRYWFADNARPFPQHALAGPFDTRDAGLWWFVEHMEAKLTPEQAALWGECLTLAGGAHADAGHLVGIIGLIAHNRPRDFILKSSRKVNFHEW